MTNLPTLGIIQQLEDLIKSQSTDSSSVIDVLTQLGTPLASIGVLDNGTIDAKFLGYPNSEDNTANIANTAYSTDTLFQACSISKPITALAVIKLCQEGKLNLDIPISEYLTAEQLSWISTPKTHSLVSQITIRLLLSHTSGFDVGGFRGYDGAEIPTIQQTLTGSPPANNRPVKLILLPGQKYAYSGGGWMVIQLILETHFQKPFKEIMQELVLAPLNMTHSTYRIIPRTEEKNYAPVYYTGSEKAEPDHFLLPESAAAGLWTTPSDLLKAVHAVQLSLTSGDILERRWAQEMLNEVQDNGMALGWQVQKSGMCFYHPGNNDPGYNCYLIGYAELIQENRANGEAENETGSTRGKKFPPDSGICIMTSAVMGFTAIVKILAAVLYLKGWPLPFESFWSSFPTGPTTFVDPGKQVDEQAKGWCGNWGPGGWSLVVEEKGLCLRCGESNAVQLLPAAIPAISYEEGTSIDLVVDGLEMMLRLGWKDGSRIMEVWQDGEIEVLRREPAGGCK